MIVSDDLIELEDFVPVEIQEKVLKLMTHPSFPWALTFDSVYGAGSSVVTGGKIINDNSPVGFFHNLMFNGQPRSPDLSVVLPIFKEFEKVIADKLKINKMFRIRAGLFTKHIDKTPHGAHTDDTNPHWTAVYYVNDCDGDLVLYNETYDDYTEEQAKTANLTVKHICKPTQGKLVAFNGKHYHSSSYPTRKPLRIAITFNFTTL